MSERKLDEIEQLFKKTSKPKTIIEDIDEIKKIGCFYDSTPQGENALNIATEIAKSLHLKLKVFAAEDFYLRLKQHGDEITKKSEELKTYVDNYTEEHEVATETEVLIGGRIKNVINLIEEDLAEDEKLSQLILDKLVEHKFNLFVVGAPLLRTRQEKGFFGYYLSKIVRERQVHSNFLLIPDDLKEGRKKSMMGIVNFEQEPGSVVAVLRRAMSLLPWLGKVKILGVIQDTTIETVARSEIPEDQIDAEPDIFGVRDRIKNKFSDILDLIEVSDNLNEIKSKKKVVTGVLTSAIKIELEEYNPGLVLVRTVAKLDENMDSSVEAIARIALSEGYPVLILWD